MSVAWHRPSSAEDALTSIEHGGTPVAGGAALLSPALPPTWDRWALDLAGLLGDRVSADSIGAGVTLAALAADPFVRGQWPAIAAAAAVTATPQVRAVATVGGGLGARLPTADLPAALAAHGATVDLLVPDGTASLSVVDYLADPPSRPHLVAAVRPTRTGRGGYRRFALGHGPAPALATVAGVLLPDGPELWAGAVGPTAAPVRLQPDGSPTEPLRSDDRASADYRTHLVAALAREVREELLA